MNKQLNLLNVDAQRESGTGDWVEGMVEVFKAPIVVMPGGWGDTLPDWIKGEITLQRLIRLAKGDDDLATDAEAVAYLYTAALEAPIDHEWAQIYFYLVTKLKGEAVPPDIRVETLTDYECSELDRFKRWIRERQRKALHERRKAEIRAERGQDDEQQQAKQLYWKEVF